jgi:TrmH family RNA methyltransferase
MVKLKKTKYRHQHQEAIIFGQDLVDEAKRANKIVQYFSTAPHGNHLVIAKELMDALVDYEMKDPIGAIVSTQHEMMDNQGNVLICDTIQDPRNLGALIRSAHAFEFHKIILSPECVDPYHELALRAAKGSTFHVNIEVKPLIEAIHVLKKNKYQIIASSHLPQSAPSQFSHPCALILGNEGHGISNDLIALSDVFFHIQTQSVDSLNVTVAGSIMMHQLSEQL